jgi:hypothetical protein
MWGGPMRGRRRETILDVYNLVLGILVLVMPWLSSYAHASARADDWISGALVAVTALAAVLAFAEWEEWVSLALGVWLAASPWLLGFPHAKAMPINVILGLAIAFISALELWLIHYNPAPEDWHGPAVT